MATIRHKSRASLDRYVRAGKRWGQAAGASVGLSSSEAVIVPAGHGNLSDVAYVPQVG